MKIFTGTITSISPMFTFSVKLKESAKLLKNRKPLCRPACFLVLLVRGLQALNNYKESHIDCPEHKI